MEDMERYGDYNEIDEPPGGRKSVVLVIIKIMVILATLAVVGVLGFRIYLFNYYPESMKNIYFTDGITEYYNSTGGNIGALTQNLRAPYDNEREGNFFCDNLIVVKDIGELQVSLRFNVSVIENMEKKLGLSGLSADDTDLLTFRLYMSDGGENEADHLIGELAAEPIIESKMMYRYYKLAFRGIDFGDGEEKIEWIRLEVFVKGQTDTKPFAMIAIYEDNVNYSAFTEYKLSSSEVPE